MCDKRLLLTKQILRNINAQVPIDDMLKDLPESLPNDYKILKAVIETIVE